MFAKILLAAGFLGLAQAQSYHPPGADTFNALLLPDGSHPVTRGETYKVVWNATGVSDTETVSLVLCHGDSNNCVDEKTAIVSGVPASSGHYEWAVSCDEPVGTKSTDTGYGMLIICDQTGEFQYSTQFSVLAGTKCGSTPSNSTSTAGSSSSSSWATSSMSQYTTMTAPSNYTHTTVKQSTSTTVQIVTSSPVASTTSSATPAATSTAFHGAATQLGGSAAALVLAAGAAFLAL